jgi:tetratricopeptide (TPR) repeat protein
LTTVPLDELDRMILSNCHEWSWRKTEAVLGKAIHECEGRELSVSDRQLFDRLVYLVDASVLEALGNLASWRRSEVRLFSADRGPLRHLMRYTSDIDAWLDDLRLSRVQNEISGEEAINRVQSELDQAVAQERLTLALNLNALLIDAGRNTEALQLIDKMIVEAPENVQFLIAKASLLFHQLGDPPRALEAINLALDRASRTISFRRQALNEKARMLMHLRRGRELAEILEQIMVLKIPPGVPDVVRQRDFVDDAPPELLSADVVARFDAFCPKPTDDLLPSEPPKWTALDEEGWSIARSASKRDTSTDKRDSQGEVDPWWKAHKWVRQLRNELSTDEVIDRVKERLEKIASDDDERLLLRSELQMLLIEAFRRDEVLQLIDDEIERSPGHTRPLISKASFYHYTCEDPQEGLKWIDIALENARRTKFFRREALGTKARMLLELCTRDGVDRGDVLGHVLEEIMSLDLYRDYPDVGKERDFVDRGARRMIPADIVAGYDKFAPKSDRGLEIHRWADEVRSKLPIEQAIDRVRSQLDRAKPADTPTLAHILGMFLLSAERYDEALSCFDMAIDKDANHVRSTIAKAIVLKRKDPDKAITTIDIALERAFRTRFYRRHALGEKARILVKLGRGELLGQVLEQIMALEMFSDVRDIGRERDFVDCAPPGLIDEGILARYNAFCPPVPEVG